VSRGDVMARCKVVASPSPVSREEHARAEAELEARLASVPGLVAVYRTGGVSAPGISDIDRVAVLESPVPINPVWSDLSESTRSIAMHTPFAVDKDTFERHRWFAHLVPLDLVSGDGVPSGDSALGRHGLRLLGVEGLVISLLKLLKQRTLGRLKARPLLCELHALRHSLQHAELTPEIAPAAWRLMNDVAEARQRWFQQQPPDREAGVQAIAEQAPSALLDALERLPAVDGADEDGPKPLRMSAPWGNVTIVRAGGQADTAATFRTPRTAGLTSRSRRLPELGWRLRSRSLAVPAAALAWLHPPRDPDMASLRAERDSIVLRYAAFVDACGGGWSSIGFARTFLPR
jgi:hypothetical protein